MQKKHSITLSAESDKPLPAKTEDCLFRSRDGVIFSSRDQKLLQTLLVNIYGGYGSGIGLSLTSFDKPIEFSGHHFSSGGRFKFNRDRRRFLQEKEYNFTANTGVFLVKRENPFDSRSTWTGIRYFAVTDLEKFITLLTKACKDQKIFPELVKLEGFEELFTKLRSFQPYEQLQQNVVASPTSYQNDAGTVPLLQSGPH